MIKKSIFACLLSVGMVLPSMVCDSSALVTKRISGNNKFATSVEISKESYDKSENVIIASGENFADALSGGQLSIALKAPILLTRSKNLDPNVKSEIERLGAKKVYILGGENSISESLVDELEGIEVERLSGKNRYETSDKIMEKTASIEDFQEVVIVSGEDFPDALAAAAYVKVNKTLLFLSDGKRMPTTNSVQVAIGGKSKLTLDNFKGTRIAGRNREKTSLLVAEKVYPEAKNVVIASGHNFADALSSVSLVDQKDAPILLADSVNSLETFRDYLLKNRPNVQVIGGENTIPTVVFDKINDFENTKKTVPAKPVPAKPTSNNINVSDARSLIDMNSIIINDFNGNLGYAKYDIDNSTQAVKARKIHRANRPINAGEYRIRRLSPKYCSIVKYNGNKSNVSVPAVINGMKVIEIEYKAFYNKGIRNVYIPPTILRIGEESFSDNRISKIAIPDSVIVIGRSAFHSNGMTSVIFGKNLEKIHQLAFCNNRLKSINLPAKVKEIGEMCFGSNPELVTVTYVNKPRVKEMAFDNQIPNITMESGRVIEEGKKGFVRSGIRY